jgi:hypothetical protein
LGARFTFDKTLHLLPYNDEIAAQRLPGRSRLHGNYVFTQPGPKAALGADRYRPFVDAASWCMTKGRS